MSKKGYMVEQRISAKDVEALNESAVAVTDIDSGTLVTLGAFSKDVYTVTKATTGVGNYMAYSPSELLLEVEGTLIPKPVADPRAYTNLAGRTFNIFKPQVGDRIGLTDGNIKTGETVAIGKFLEQTADGYVVKETPTASTTSLEVLDIKTQPFPQSGGSFGMEFAKLYVCRVAQN